MSLARKSAVPVVRAGTRKHAMQHVPILTLDHIEQRPAPHSLYSRCPCQERCLVLSGARPGQLVLLAPRALIAECPTGGRRDAARASPRPAVPVPPLYGPTLPLYGAGQGGEERGESSGGLCGHSRPQQWPPGCR